MFYLIEALHLQRNIKIYRQKVFRHLLPRLLKTQPKRRNAETPKRRNARPPADPTRRLLLELNSHPPNSWVVFPF